LLTPLVSRRHALRRITCLMSKLIIHSTWAERANLVSVSGRVQGSVRSLPARLGRLFWQPFNRKHRQYDLPKRR
jgi:hypothetical protein